MMPLFQDREELLARLKAGVAAAKQLAVVDPNRIAVIGYCFGGLCALDLARSSDPDIKGAVSFHGVFESHDFKTQAPITAKVLILHGFDDPLATPEQMVAVAKEFTDRKADWQIHAYGGTMHAFTAVGANMPERGLLYNAKADHRSWQAMKNFLAEVLS
jgi:dienelactone hydrolase